MDIPFDQWTRRAQIAALRLVARQALDGWPIDVADLRVINHDFNTTFQVVCTDGRRFALRVNVNSRRTFEQVAAEVAWVTALGTASDVTVATALERHDGNRVAVVPFEPLGRGLPAVLYSWLPGRAIGDRPSVAQARAIGRAMAHMHEHAATFDPPEVSALHTFDDPLFDSPNNLGAEHRLIGDSDRRTIEAGLNEATRAFARLFSAEKPRLLHADLHPWNVRWHEGQASVYDFDDCGIGVRTQDLAVTAYYLRDDARLEAAVHDGYTEVAPLPIPDRAAHEALLVARGLLLLNDLLVHTAADMRALVPRFLRNTVIRTRHWLETGVYVRDLPGVGPLDEPITE